MSQKEIIRKQKNYKIEQNMLQIEINSRVP